MVRGLVRGVWGTWDEPRCEMEDIKEGSDGVARRLANLGLLNQRIVEERDGVLLLLVGAAPRVAALSFLPRCRARDVEPHLGHLIPPRRGLPAFSGRRAILAVGLDAVAHGELDGNFVAAGEVRVGDLRVGDLEGRSVLYVEGELGFTELGLAPIPAAERVLLVFEVGAVPALEDFAEPFIVLSLPPH